MYDYSNKTKVSNYEYHVQMYDITVDTEAHRLSQQLTEIYSDTNKYKLIVKETHKLERAGIILVQLEWEEYTIVKDSAFKKEL